MKETLQTMRRPILIAAHTISQLDMFIHNHKLNRSECVWVHTVAGLYGRRNRLIIMLPQWWENKEQGFQHAIREGGFTRVHVTEEQVLKGTFELP